MPVRAVQILEYSQTKGNLAVYFGWGEYCIWHLFPNWKVSVDGRRETVYPSDVYQTTVRFEEGVSSRWNDLLTKHPTDVVLCSKETPTFNLMMLQKD
jgi:hypothetical protein